MGQKFRQYTNFLSLCELKSLVAIEDGRITTAPIQDPDTTIEPGDFFSGDDSLFASFDLDEAIRNLNRKRAAPSPLGGEPMNANSGDEPNVENTTANIDSIQSDTATSSPPAAKRPQSHSAGRTVYNQKEGNRVIPSPSQMVLQLPINLNLVYLVFIMTLTTQKASVLNFSFLLSPPLSFQSGGLRPLFL
jgi:hypothetical protein